MSHRIAALASVGVLLLLTARVAASPIHAPRADGAATQRPSVLVPTHAIRGVVKSIGTSSLVIVAAGKKVGEMTFLLAPSTHREGDLRVGATVSIRYRREGDALMATGVSAQPEKLRKGAVSR